MNKIYKSQYKENVTQHFKRCKKFTKQLKNKQKEIHLQTVWFQSLLWMMSKKDLQ